MHFEITFAGRSALVFRINIQCGPEPVRRPPKKKEAHIDRLVNTEDLVLLHSFAVVHHKDSGSAAIKKMPVKGINHFDLGMIPSPQIEGLPPFIEISG
jgi:hypothetical protein